MVVISDGLRQINEKYNAYDTVPRIFRWRKRIIYSFLSLDFSNKVSCQGCKEMYVDIKMLYYISNQTICYVPRFLLIILIFFR